MVNYSGRDMETVLGSLRLILGLMLKVEKEASNLA
jgi:hypothetical protein